MLCRLLWTVSLDSLWDRSTGSSKFLDLSDDVLSNTLCLFEEFGNVAEAFLFILDLDHYDKYC